jgi:hypothetical protein
MKRSILPALLALAFAWTCPAASLEKGMPFPKYTVTDAFGATNTLAADTRFVIVSSEKDVSAKVHAWLAPKGKDFLPSHKAEYVSDITPMPGLITTMFALPKMKKYPYKILLADDPQFAKTYPSQPGKIAVFTLDEQQHIAEIQFVGDGAAVEAIIAPAPAP